MKEKYRISAHPRGKNSRKDYEPNDNGNHRDPMTQNTDVDIHLLSRRDSDWVMSGHCHREPVGRWEKSAKRLEQNLRALKVTPLIEVMPSKDFALLVTRESKFLVPIASLPIPIVNEYLDANDQRDLHPNR